MNIVVWDVTEPLDSELGLLCFVSFAKTNTSFKVCLTDPVTGSEVIVYQNDVLPLLNESYSVSSYRTDPLRIIFHKIML